ncbi:unnamed protein product [Heligmosomoides polygyrus]|uniref:DUF5641 domain-containing protein n=1 Tax=Heligmosomoides polygyrus TaxID=6339 RepID=A0A183GA22_HELPZ|nr:unnamed protein product [Heligmosomoides polygyrus]
MGLLTRATNRLSKILKDEDDLLHATIEPASADDANLRALRSRIRQAKVVIEAEAQKLEKALDNYSTAADSLKDDTPSISEILAKVEQNTEAAQGLLDHAYNAMTTLARLQESIDDFYTHSSRCRSPGDEARSSPYSEVQRRDLGERNVLDILRAHIVGTVVLISEALTPRNTWKMGRIVKLHQSLSNAIREVEVRLPNGCTIRRPVNMLIPLELHQQPDTDKEQTIMDEPSDGKDNSQHLDPPRYNLRPRSRRITTAVKLAHVTATTICLLLMMTLLPNASAEEPSSNYTYAEGQMLCVPGGVHLLSKNIRRYELCANEHCQVKDNPERNETVLFPPEATLHEHDVLWKFSDGNRMTIVETTCSPISFCDKVQCWFCTANIFNPKCSPKAAILASAVILYGVIAMTYLVCYVPIVIFYS